MKRWIVFVTAFCLVFTFAFILLWAQSTKGKESPLRLAQTEQKTKPRRPAPPPLPMMGIPQGPTITISGKVIYEGYKSEEYGPIYIWAKSKVSVVGADIASTSILRPGRYSLKVPRNRGDVYIAAVVMERVAGAKRPTLLPDSPMGYYLKNPIKVGSSDIQGVDITVETLRK